MAWNWAAHELQDGLELGAAFRIVVGPRAAQFVEELPEGLRIESDELGRTQALIDEAPDQAQFVYLLRGIDPFAVGIADRQRKAVTPLPDPQCVLGQTGIALDGCNRQAAGSKNWCVHCLSWTKR